MCLVLVHSSMSLWVCVSTVVLLCEYHHVYTSLFISCGFPVWLAVSRIAVMCDPEPLASVTWAGTTRGTENWLSLSVERSDQCRLQKRWAMDAEQAARSLGRVPGLIKCPRPLALETACSMFVPANADRHKDIQTNTDLRYTCICRYQCTDICNHIFTDILKRKIQDSIYCKHAHIHKYTKSTLHACLKKTYTYKYTQINTKCSTHKQVHSHSQNALQSCNCVHTNTHTHKMKL